MEMGRSSQLGISLQKTGKKARSGMRKLRCIVSLSLTSSCIGRLNWMDADLCGIIATSAISVPFIIHSLFAAKYLPPKSKILLVSSESGSIFLRHEKEGGGNYAHHASKAALNMVGKLLSLDLKEDGVVISIVHPGFMRTEMTAGVGFDKYWDDGGGEFSNLWSGRGG
jgi:NAD(P)-dependent dehydrogenase (short-subunit alcohol dehydrogenase family)